MSGVGTRLRHALKRIAFSPLPSRLREEIDAVYYIRRLRRGDFIDEPEAKFVSRWIHNGSVAVDAGANLGGYTLLMAGLVGASGSVDSFEPVPRTFRLLDRAIQRLAPFATVRLHNLALSDSSGEARIHVPLEGRLENYYTASLWVDGRQRSSAINVRTTTLDEWRAEHGRRVEFLKVDVEGAELALFRGARDILQHDRPIVLCEIGEGARDGSTSTRDVADFLSDNLYASFQLVRGRFVRSIVTERKSSSANFLLIPEERTAEVLRSTQE